MNTASCDKTLLISDLHLDPGAPGIARQFLAFLETNYPRLHAIQRVSHEVLRDYQVYLSASKTVTLHPLSER